MTAHNSLQLRRYAELVVPMCPGGSTSQDIIYLLSSLGRSTSSDLLSSCTERGAQPCHILSQLSDWNRGLQPLDIELKEVSPGEFGLLALPTLQIPRIEAGPVNEWALVHWLLKEHRCIKTFALPRTSDARYHGLLSDALRANSVLRKVSLADSRGTILFADVVSAIGTLSSLEKLYLNGVCHLRPSAFNHLASALIAMPLMKSLTLPTALMNIGDADGVAQTKLLIRALMQCPNIAVLVSGLYVLKPDDGCVFAELVAQSTTLRQLTLRRGTSEPRFHLKRLFSAVASNSNIEELQLELFHTDEEELQLLAQVVAQHSSLRCLQIDASVRNFKVRVHESVISDDPLERTTGLRELVVAANSLHCLAVFGQAIHQKTRMDRLYLTNVGLGVSGHLVTLKASARNRSLELISSELFPEHLPTHICTLIKEAAMKRKANIEADIRDPLEFLSDPRNSARRVSPLPSSLLVGLLCHRSLVELNILLGRLVDTEHATSLALFLSAADSLTDVSLTFVTTQTTTRTLLQGISNSRGLTGLSIAFWAFQAPEFDLLWQAVRACGALEKLELKGLIVREGQAPNRLPQVLHENHLLLEVSIELQALLGARVPFQFEIKELMRRNLSTLHRATQFAMGSRGRQFAVAFERLSGASTLVEALKKTSGESEDEANVRVRRSVRYLDEHFLVEAGVVRDAVVCTGPGRYQLDRIGLDDWLCIRRYLRVTDIVLDSTTSSLGSSFAEEHPADHVDTVTLAGSCSSCF